MPRFAHLLIDQSQVIPQAVRGELHGRTAPLMMMARYRHRREALRHAAQLLAELLPEGDEDAIRPLVLYLWAAQDPDTARRFTEELRGAVSGPGGAIGRSSKRLPALTRTPCVLSGSDQGRRRPTGPGSHRGR